MKTLGIFKVGLSVVGIFFSLQLLKAASSHLNAHGSYLNLGETALAEEKSKCAYINAGLAVVLAGASIKIMVDKSTYQS